MLASSYGSPLFDAKGILEGPGYHPIGKSGSSGPNFALNSPATPETTVAKGKRGQYRGPMGKKFIQDKQFVPSKFDPSLGTPLSQPNADGNEADTALGTHPVYAEPINGTLVDVMNRINTRENVEDFVGRLTAADIDKQLKGHIKMYDGNKKMEDMVENYVAAQAMQKKQTTLRSLMDQGFTKDEANKAYEESRKEEAKQAMKTKAAAPALGSPSPTKSIIRSLMGGPVALGPTAGVGASAFRPIQHSLLAAAPAPFIERAVSPRNAAPLPGARSVSVPVGSAGVGPAPRRPRSSLGNITTDPHEMIQRLRDAGLPISPTMYSGSGPGRKGSGRGGVRTVRMSQTELVTGTMDEARAKAKKLAINFAGYVDPDQALELAQNQVISAPNSATDSDKKSFAAFLRDFTGKR